MLPYRLAGMWLSLVERSVRDREVVGSNPAIPTRQRRRQAADRGSAVSVSREKAMISEFLHWLGFGLCHQLPERSFFGGGVQVPVCARDEGLYVGFLIAFVIIWLLHRPRRPRELPGPAALVVCALFLGSMVVDGVTSYGGIRETTNVIRLLTGAMAGYSLAALVAPLLNDELWLRADSIRVLSPVWRLVAWALSVPLVVLIVLYGGPLLGVGYPLAVAAAIIATFLIVNLVLAVMLSPFERKAQRPRDLLAPLAIALLLTALEFVLASLLKLGLLALGS